MLNWLFGPRAADAERIAELEGRVVDLEAESSRNHGAASAEAARARKAEDALGKEQFKVRELEDVLGKIAGNLCPGNTDPKFILAAAAKAIDDNVRLEKQVASYTRRHKSVCDEFDALKAELRPLLESADPASLGDPVTVGRVVQVFWEMKRQRDESRKQADAAKAEAVRAEDYRQRVAEELAGLRRKVAALEADLAASNQLIEESQASGSHAEARYADLWRSMNRLLSDRPIHPPAVEAGIPDWAVRGIAAVAADPPGAVLVMTDHKPAVPPGPDPLLEADTE